MTSVFVHRDLDSSVIKALRLLHSTDSDSENQLKQLWKQSVLEKYGSTRVPTSVLHKIRIPASSKRSFQEENSDWETENKKFKSENFNATQEPPASTQNTYSSYSTEDIIFFSSSSDSDEDPALEMLTVTGICTKCKASFSLHNNKLVECVGCQRHYHQQCHFPPIRDTDLSDPRFVWYCFSCEENITSTTVNERTKNVDSNSPSKPLNPSKNGRLGASFNIKISSGSNGSKLINDCAIQTATSTSVRDKKMFSSKKHNTKKHEKRKLTK